MLCLGAHVKRCVHVDIKLLINYWFDLLALLLLGEMFLRIDKFMGSCCWFLLISASCASSALWIWRWCLRQLPLWLKQLPQN